MLNASENSVLKTENNSFWSILREAVTGSQRNFTQGSIGLAIFLLAVPMIAYTLAYHFGFGADGVFWAITIAFSLLAIVSGILFKRGKWKAKIV